MNQFSKKTRIIEKYLVAIMDLLSIVVSYFLGIFLRYRNMREFDQPDQIILLGLILFSVLLNFLVDWNRFLFQRGYYTEIFAVIKYTLCMAVAFSGYVFLAREGENYSRIVYGLFLILNAVITYLCHIIMKKVLRTYYRKSQNSDKVMIVTNEEYIQDIIEKVKMESDWSYEVVGITLMNQDLRGRIYRGIPVIANAEDVFDVAKNRPLDAVLIYMPDLTKKEMTQIINIFELMGIICHQCVEILDESLAVPLMGRFAGIPVITYATREYDYRRLMVKRVIDICGGLVGMIITIIMFPFVAIAIKLTSKGPVFFVQTRIGRNGRRFDMYKFRSMYIDAEERKAELLKHNEMSNSLMFKMENDPRITPVGRFLRKTSIDELPQFWNILIGDMSLVGTRPPTEDEFEQYSIRYRRRMSLTPGLTGMWQVKGRGEATEFEDVIKYDLEYIDNWSLSLDIKLILQTIIVVLTGKGAK